MPLLAWHADAGTFVPAVPKTGVKAVLKFVDVRTHRRRPVHLEAEVTFHWHCFYLQTQVKQPRLVIPSCS